MRYLANFTANSGTTLVNPIKGGNKAQIIRDIRTIAEGNRHLGNGCFWQVFNEEHILVAEGGTTCSGKRYRNF